MPNDPLIVLPCLSIALQLTVVVPTEKREPEGGEHTGFSVPSTISKAETYAEYEIGVVLLPVAFTLRLSAGRVRVGAVVSLTTILNDFVTDLTLLLMLPELPAPPPLLVALYVSLTEQVTVVVPIGKTDPEGGEHNGKRITWC